MEKKKTAIKKRAKKAPAVKEAVKKHKIVTDAPTEQYFILCNGQPVKNVKELAEVIEDLRDEIFEHHVTADKNDFATWIHDVFKEVELAEELAGVKNKKDVRIVLYKHIVKKVTQ